MGTMRTTKSSGVMTDAHFKELLVPMTEVLNPVKPAANFSRAPGQASI